MERAVPEELITVCRFCLCEDDDCLIPIEDLLDFEITTEDLERFSGIEINDDNKATFSVCMDCTSKLKVASTFRNTCLKNDPLFRDLYQVLVASGKERLQKVVARIELSDTDDGMDDEDAQTKPVVIYLNDPLWKPSKQSVPEVAPKPERPKRSVEIPPVVTEDDDGTQHSEAFSCASTTDEVVCDGELFAYSANYIEPGEELFDPNEMWQMFFNWGGSLNPPYPEVRELGKKKKKRYLCDICGFSMSCILRHYDNHSEEQIHSCPHCPVKMKQKSNIAQHILTMHLKQNTRKCAICGKGFIHHKTYRYHMLTHEGEGKTFECPDCEKTFPNAIYLRDHFNRLHNAAKAAKKTQPAKKVRRKRNQPQIMAA
ncbi:zinc finger protein 418 [Anopheles gambiae]|uniref:zinc finger protein 418 n=1 Tax=Anopheles gambiae TaxID=7165 RepID=UPI002AC945E7|nr:zinc finger protein 418 [Anopheles gambiae]